MKIFHCDNCDHPVYFENEICEKCGYALGYYEHLREIVSLEPAKPFWNFAAHADLRYKYCENYASKVCNWLVPQNSQDMYCTACKFNRTIPSLHSTENFEKWRKLEFAKHRLIFQLQRLGLPLQSKMESELSGLCFDFVSNEEAEPDNKVKMGHANGVITILLSEADAVHREQMRKHLSEPYRTLIGHFRHEIGHYYWDRLIGTNSSLQEDFRKIFGDERQDYGEALQRYYANESLQNWQSNFISKYATSHPWEDWAESWAHYLHLMDTLETAYFFGLSTRPHSNSESIQSSASFDPYEISDFQKIIDNCVGIFFAINSINRSMGIPDVYPFITTPPIIEKLKFIHALCRSSYSINSVSR